MSEKELGQVVDIELFAKEGKKPPKNARYKIRINREKFIVDAPSMSGRELLELAGKKPPEQYFLFQKYKHDKIEIGLEDIVDFTKPGVERFLSLPKDQTDGHGNA